MSPPSPEEIVRAARAILPELPTLLGDDAPEVRHRLQLLLARAERGEPVTDEIVELLRSRSATRVRLTDLLSFEEHVAAAPATTAAAPPPSPVGTGPPSPPDAAPRSAPGGGGGWLSRLRPKRARRDAGVKEPSGGRTRGLGHEGEASAAPDEETDATDIEEAPRWILSQVWDLTDPLAPRRMRRGFHAGADHAIKVRIGPIEDDWFAAEGATAEDSVGAQLPGGVEHTLAAIFFVPALGLKDRKTLVLPASGSSDVVTFSLPPFAHRDRIEAWISLVFEGRHIQSARLTGFALDDPDSAPDEAAISMQWAALVPGLTEPGLREAFDASVLLDARGEGVAGVGVPDADAIIAFGDDHVDKVLNDIRVLLRGLVDAPTLFVDMTSDASVGLLRSLAFQGRILHELVGERLERELRGRPMERIQIVQTDRIDYAPLEFVYDLPTPSEDAGICEGWKDQLASGVGRCPESNHPPAARPDEVTKVCPLGFWALSRVIERQIIEARDVRSEAFAVRVAPTKTEPSLSPVGHALFGFSTRLDATVGGQSAAVLNTLNGITNDHANVVDTWEAWASAISDRPSLLVLLSHTVEHQSVTALEIGPEVGGSRLKLIELVPALVKAEPTDAPVVLLLGCDTAVERNEFRSFVGQFLDCGAALVVGTITPVLGEHVAPVANALIHHIASALTADGQPAEDRASTFGELMLRVRRGLLTEGELTALCIASFGDADWRLGPSSE
jgi:hypothetical protein